MPITKGKIDLSRLQLGLIVSALAFGSTYIRAQDSKQVHIAFRSEFSTLNSITSLASDSLAENLRSLLHNSLLRKNERLEYVGDLAETIEFSPRRTVVTFSLKKNVHFHNGKELTSKDVKYTFDELIKSNGYKAGGLYEPYVARRTPLIRELVVIDSHRIKFTVSNVASMKVLLSTISTIPIIPVGSIELQETKPVGTGPFIFVGSDPSGNSVELRANPKYWEGSPWLQTILIEVVPDAATLVAKLRNGSIDIANVDYHWGRETLKLIDQESQVRILNYPGPNIQYLGFNTRSRILRKKQIRHAIAFSIDREKIVNEFLSGRARIADSTLPPDSWASSATKHYTYNPAKAKSLLKLAGYRGEMISLKVSGGSQFHSLALNLNKYFSEAGINVSIEPLDAGTLRSDLVQGNFDLSLGTWIGGNQDPLFLYDLFATAKIPRENVSCCNRSRYTNEAVDNLLARARDTFSHEVEKTLYKLASDQIFEDLPLFPMWYPDRIILANKRVTGIKLNPDGDWSFLRQVQVQ